MTEYCVMHYNFPDEPHRGPWPLRECQEWIREAVEEDGIRPGAFYIAERTVSNWSRL